MKTMSQLVEWFQLEYPELVKEMRISTHHNEETGDINPYHQEGDIFCHTMMVCKQAENLPYEVQIAALLHDIGKPATRKVNPKNGRVSFFNHDSVSAFMSLEILKRPELGLSDEQRIMIFRMIALHTQVYKLTPEQLAAIGDPKLVENLIMLGNADHEGRFHSHEGAEIVTIEDVPFDVTKLERKEKEVIVLCGLPASGKSTWVHNNIYNRNTGETSLIVSRDHYFTEHFPDLDYNKAWNQVNQRLVDRWMIQKFNYAKTQSKVLVDMTHMSKKSRKRSLSHFGPEYKKKCVIFLTDLQTLKERNENREGKTIDSRVIDRMMKSFYLPTLEEFDEIEYVLT